MCSAAVSDKSSEEWRHETEARHVANLPDDRARQDYLKGVRKHRGEDAARKLRAAAWAILNKKE